MIKTIINEAERGLAYINGVLKGYLRPGKQRIGGLFDEVEVVLIPPGKVAQLLEPGMEKVLPEDEALIVDVGEGMAALVSRDQKPELVLETGRWVVWLFAGAITVDLVDLRPLRTAIPTRFWPLAKGLVLDIVVTPSERALVYGDGVLAEVLEGGRYGLGLFERRLDIQRVDLREVELQVVGQELLTQDKVSLRLNLVFKYRIEDPIAATHRVDNLRDALYAEVQLAARAMVASVTVDALIEQRVALAGAMIDAVATRAKGWGVVVEQLAVKDIVLPGDMKLLLNQVIEAEKRAAAQNILRREETAATRSLANTARLLESNPILLRLKEIEMYKEMAEKIPNLSVVIAPKDLQDRLRLGEG